MKERSYEITERAMAIGGGWSLKLYEDGEEVGGGVLPDHSEAIEEGESWSTTIQPRICP